MKMLNDLFLAQERRCLCGEGWIFQQDNAAVYIASITKKYLLKQKIRPLDHQVYPPDVNPIENLCGLIDVKIYEGERQNTAISELENAILDTWEKYLQFNFKN